MAKNVTMYTSYWFDRRIPNRQSDLYIVQICISKPNNSFAQYNFQEVAPDWSTLSKHKRGQINDGVYYAEYIQKLFANKKIIADKIVDIYHRANGKKVVFCCWETPDKFCHRHIFAEFANKQFNNLNIIEL